MNQRADSRSKPGPDISHLLTIRDLAQLLQVHRRTISRLCAAGVLPRPLRLGGSIRWRAQEIDHALARLGTYPDAPDEALVSVTQRPVQ